MHFFSINLVAFLALVTAAFEAALRRAVMRWRISSGMAGGVLHPWLNQRSRVRFFTSDQATKCRKHPCRAAGCPLQGHSELRPLLAASSPITSLRT